MLGVGLVGERGSMGKGHGGREKGYERRGMREGVEKKGRGKKEGRRGKRERERKRERGGRQGEAK